ncbi:MAG TPA: transcription elongation factor GreA [Rhodospirillales bacterium]|nr:transcription elongation factor GreA [Rhodospirillales bacterium]
MQKLPMTKEGVLALEDEQRRLKEEERPAIIQAIAEAREHGDLSENAEYHAARERQSFVEGRLAELKSIISLAEIIDPTKLSGDMVRFGATVELADEETDAESTYQIVGTHEADINKGRLSVTAPLARAMIGKSLGDSIEVVSPGGSKFYEIIKVDYK